VPENLEEEIASEFALESKVQFNHHEYKIDLCTGICKNMTTKL